MVRINYLARIRRARGRVLLVVEERLTPSYSLISLSVLDASLKNFSEALHEVTLSEVP